MITHKSLISPTHLPCHNASGERHEGLTTHSPLLLSHWSETHCTQRTPSEVPMGTRSLSSITTDSRTPYARCLPLRSGASSPTRGRRRVCYSVLMTQRLPKWWTCENVPLCADIPSKMYLFWTTSVLAAKPLC